MKYIGENKRF